MYRKVLISGASGLIGKALQGKLNSKTEWTALTTQQNKADGKRWFYWNPSKGEMDSKALDGITHIIHLAGASIAQPWTSSNKKEIMDSRVLSTQLLNKTLSENKHSVQKFISASGIGIYPQSDGMAKTESSDTGNDFPARVCLAWEAEALKIKEINIPVHIVRTGIVLSKDGGALKPIIAPIKLFAGAALGKGSQYLSWIHIEDMARVYLQLLEENQWPEIINAVAPGAVTNKVFTELAADVLKKPLWLPNVPAFVLKTVLGERSILVLEGAEVRPDALIHGNFHFKFSELRQALEDLLD